MIALTYTYLFKILIKLLLALPVSAFSALIGLLVLSIYNSVKHKRPIPQTELAVLRCFNLFFAFVLVFSQTLQSFRTALSYFVIQSFLRICASYRPFYVRLKTELKMALSLTIVILLSPLAKLIHLPINFAVYLYIKSPIILMVLVFNYSHSATLAYFAFGLYLRYIYIPSFEPLFHLILKPLHLFYQVFNPLVNGIYIPLINSDTAPRQWSPNQTTHYKDAQQSCSTAAISLKNTYPNASKNSINNLKGAIENLTLAEIDTSIKQNAIDYLEYGSKDFKDPGSGLLISELLGLCFSVIKDKNNLKESRTQRQAIAVFAQVIGHPTHGMSESEHYRSYINPSYMCICSQGQFNKIMEALSAISQLVNIIILNNQMVTSAAQRAILSAIYLPHKIKHASIPTYKNINNIVSWVFDGDIAEPKAFTHPFLSENSQIILSDVMNQFKSYSEVIRADVYHRFNCIRASMYEQFTDEIHENNLIKLAVNHILSQNPQANFNDYKSQIPEAADVIRQSNIGYPVDVNKASIQGVLEVNTQYVQAYFEHKKSTCSGAQC